MRRPATIISSVILFAGWCATSSAQTAAVNVSVDSVLVGEHFLFTVAVRADPGQVVIFPPLSGGSLAIGDAEFIKLVSEPGPPAAIDTATYEVAVFGVDSAIVGGLPIGILQADGDTLVFSTPSVQVGIRSVVPEDAAGLKDLLPLATFPLALWPWILGGVLALVALWLLLRYMKERSSRQPAVVEAVAPRLDPYDEALGRLRELAAMKVHGEEGVQRYHDELSDILRTYIEKTLAVPALERTTRELLGALRQLSQVATDYVSPEAVKRVAESLAISDLVKFAKYSSADRENQLALDLARESIDDIEGGRRRRTIAEQTEAA